jgi:hypothetical protein
MGRSRAGWLVVVAAWGTAANLAVPVLTLTGILAALVLPMALVIAGLSLLDPTPRQAEDGLPVDEAVPDLPGDPEPFVRPRRPPRPAALR